MEYDIKVNFGSGWESLDLFEAPSMVFENSTVTNLNDRRTSYSQRIRLPKTAKNLSLFEYIDTWEVTTDIPYKTFPVRMYSGGLSILPSDQYVIYIDQITEYIECQIISSAKDFFTQIEDIKLEDIEGIEELSIPWTYADMLANVEEPEEGEEPPLHKWAVFQPMFPMEHIRFNQAITPLQLYFCRPVINFHRFVRKALTLQGYSILSDMEDPGDYINLETFDPQTTANTVNVEGVMQKLGTELPVGNTVWPLYVSTPTFLMDGGYNCMYAADAVITNSDGQTTARGMLYHASGHCFISLETTMTWNSPRDVSLEIPGTITVIRISKRGTQIDSNSYGYTFKESSNYMVLSAITDNTLIELNEGESLFVSCQLQEPTEGTITTPQNFACVCRFALRPENNQNGIPGMTIPVAHNIGFKTLADLLRAYLQTYNLTFDLKGKVLSMYSFNSVYSNKSKPIDWSEKFNTNISTYSVRYSLDEYVQYNFIDKQENQYGDIDRGVLPVNNKSLDLEQTIYELPFMTGGQSRIDYYYGSGLYQWIVAQLYDYDEEKIQEHRNTATVPTTNQTINYLGNGTFLLKLEGLKAEDGTESEYLVPVSTWYRAIDFKPTVPLWLAQHRTMDEIVQKYYSRFISSVLTNPMVVECEILLDPMDMYDLNMFTPVRIDFFNKTFYILRINNYIAGQMSEVTLIKL